MLPRREAVMTRRKLLMFALGAALVALSFVAARPRLIANVGDSPSWDVSVPMTISWVSAGAFLGGLGLMVASIVGGRPGRRAR